MRWKKTLLNDAKLYLILDRQVRPYEQLFEIARDAIEAGVDVIQLRDKQGAAEDILDFSKRLSGLTRERALLMVNDHADAARAGHADGVHLGQEDLPLAEARSLLGPDAVIGISCQTLEQAREAEVNRADYIGFGSVFKTLTKPERLPMNLGLLEEVVRTIKIPVFAIGGITLSGMNLLISRGVGRVAVCREICLAGDVKAVVRQFKMSLPADETWKKQYLRG